MTVKRRQVKRGRAVGRLRGKVHGGRSCGGARVGARGGRTAGGGRTGCGLVALVCVAAALLISPPVAGATQPPVDVRVREAERETVVSTIEYAGRLRPQRTVTHRADITGVLERLEVGAGDVVEPDQALATLRRRSGSSEFRPVAVRARIAGVITEVLASEGDELREGDELLRVADTSRLVAEVFLSDKDVDAVSRGDHVTARDTQRGHEFSAVVSRAGLMPDYRTGLFPVEIAVNPDPRSFIGQFLRFEFETGARSGVWVEREHLVLRRGAYHLFVLEGDEVALRRVTLGEEHGDKVMIEDGVSEGERFVVWSRGRLQDGRRVNLDE